MDVSVENTDGLQRQIKVNLGSDQVEEAVEAKVRRAGQHAKVPGFRPGKVPMKVLYQRYGDAARQEVASELIQSSYPEAVNEAELKPASQPEIEIDETADGQGLTYTATFDVYPEIELQGLDNIAVTRSVVEVTSGDIDTAIERLREQSKEDVAVERESQDGDKVVVDYEGKLDSETFEGGTGNDVEVTLGEGRFLPDLERALVGRKAGETFEQDVTFPEDYNAEDLAGKTAQFSVTLKSVTEPKLPELDAEFLQQFGIEDGSVDALREKLNESLRQQADQAIESQVKQQVMDTLYEQNPIDVPESMVKQEMQQMRQETASRLPEQMQQDASMLEQLMPEDTLREPAQRRSAIGLLLAEVIQAKELEMDSERLEAKLDEMAGQYGDQAEQIKQYYRSNQQMMQGIEAMVMEDQVIQSLMDAATVTEQSTTLDDLMNEQGSGQ